VSRARHALGAFGETKAARYLKKRGYRILARNERNGGVEIDIVASRRDTLVFVEVKTRRSRSMGAPALAVDYRKRAQIVRGALAWLRKRGSHGHGIRFDVIGCEPDTTGGWKITHIEGAFDAGDTRC